ncbi:dhh family [Fusarium longipes]|uniref:Dhh family n=1 Tax=Fusarium longipes TaxID=694270 RepID=A0A395SX61_9HYPO|nr:dhh family [Fusarium longipes]
MKRSASAARLKKEEQSPKKARSAETTTKLPEYHETPSRRDDNGEIIWPAPKDQIEAARNFIRECVAASKPTLIIPDKDADGLAAGAILRKALILLGLDPELISAYVMKKGLNVHDEESRSDMASYKPSFIFVLDQGSRESPPLIDEPHRALVIDHHYAEKKDHPKGATFVTACDSPPVATSSLLTYLICHDLHHDVEETCSWLCAVGVHGDLGNSIKWEPPFPDFKAMFKKYTKKAINTVVSLINAPRRTAAYDVPGAWKALEAASAPIDILQNETLRAAREEVNEEVRNRARIPPQFSSDGRIAVFRINSQAQIHPVIATRWAGHLTSPKLEVILVANEGYLPGLVNFSCRVPKCARGKDPPVNIIKILREEASRANDPTLRKRLGESFARGHKEASGGIVPKAEFEEFMEVLEVGKKAPISPKQPQKGVKKQGNTLHNYFGKG